MTKIPTQELTERLETLFLIKERREINPKLNKRLTLLKIKLSSFHQSLVDNYPHSQETISFLYQENLQELHTMEAALGLLPLLSQVLN